MLVGISRGGLFVYRWAARRPQQVAAISGASMTEAMSNGTFFERYKRYFRFSAEEMESRRDGMVFDKLPAPPSPVVSMSVAISSNCAIDAAATIVVCRAAPRSTPSWPGRSLVRNPDTTVPHTGWVQPDQLPAESQARLTPEEVEALITEAADRARIVIKANLTHLKRLKERLLEKETIDADEVKKVLEGTAMPKAAALY
mgnify:CR=1 FL=1